MTLNANQRLLVSAYKQYTEDNHHTKALMMLAQAVGRYNDVKILQHVEKIALLEGELPHYLSQYRETIRKNVERVARETSPELWAAIIS